MQYNVANMLGYAKIESEFMRYSNVTLANIVVTYYRYVEANL